MARRRRRLSPAAERRRRHLLEGAGLATVVAVALFLSWLAMQK
jgi:hypothetical protein